MENVRITVKAYIPNRNGYATDGMVALELSEVEFRMFQKGPYAPAGEPRLADLGRCLVRALTKIEALNTPEFMPDPEPVERERSLDEDVKEFVAGHLSAMDRPVNRSRRR